MTSSASRSSLTFVPPSSANLARRLEAELRGHRNPARADGEKAYLKSDLAFLGVDLPTLRSVVRSIHREHPQLDRATLIGLVTTLWSRAVFESRMAAVLLLDAYQPLLQTKDIALIERLIRESRTWAFVDELAIAITGPLVERTPALLRVIDRWSKDRDFWVRRSALLALLPPLRRGAGDFDRFARYADTRLEEHEFFIRKAIGWVLRETSKKRPDVVYRWLLPRAGRASGVTVREAVKYLSISQRDAVLKAYRSAARATVASAPAPR